MTFGAAGALRRAGESRYIGSFLHWESRWRASYGEHDAGCFVVEGDDGGLRIFRGVHTQDKQRLWVKNSGVKEKMRGRSAATRGRVALHRVLCSRLRMGARVRQGLGGLYG